jgi:hypothetical protein
LLSAILGSQDRKRYPLIIVNVEIKPLPVFVISKAVFGRSIFLILNHPDLLTLAAQIVMVRLQFSLSGRPKRNVNVA